MDLSDLSDSTPPGGELHRRGGAVEYVLGDLTRLIEGGMVVVGERLPSETGPRWSGSPTT